MAMTSDPQSFNEDGFKSAYACFPKDVTVISVIGSDGAAYGIMVSYFTSASLFLRLCQSVSTTSRKQWPAFFQVSHLQ